jgi:hypothetical protein
MRMVVCPLTLALLLLTSCAPKSGTPVPVSGKVYFKGMPLQAGLIVFTPDAAKGESGPSAYGEIGPDGSYQLKMDKVAGANPGWYRVTVASLSNAFSSLDTPPVSLIPERYRDPQLSQLQIEVLPNIHNLHDVEVKE